MKKFAIITLSLICIFSSFLFAACKDNKINMNRYFSSTVTASVYGDKADNLSLSQVTSSKPYATKKYTQYLITADNNWFNGMYIETITFYIYSTETKEVEFNIILTGMENGIETLSSVTKDFMDNQHVCYLEANKGVKVTVNVNDKVNLTTNSKLTIAPSDITYAQFENDSFMYCIYGLEIVGYHK